MALAASAAPWAAATALGLAGGPAGSALASGPAENLTTQVVSVRPHDPTAFTQGLVLHEGWLYESTGRDRGEARLRQVDPRTGEAVREVYLPPAEGGGHYWGEGLALVGSRLVQLTWLHGIAFEYDLDTFQVLGRHRYEGEGWGLCHDGTRLVMSNGSGTLVFRDPVDFSIVGSVAVTDEGRGVDRLNELECVGDDVFANVFLTDRIARIDPASGVVEAWIDAGGLLDAEEAERADVLNGIAHDPEAGTFLVTGKWWPKLFEVRFVPPAGPAPAPAYVPLAARGS